MANNNVISIDIPDYSTTILARKSCEISIGDIIKCPVGYLLAFYYQGTCEPITVRFENSSKIKEIEDEKRKKCGKQDKWRIDVVCYKNNKFTFNMPWGYRDNEWRSNGTVTWEITNPQKLITQVVSPTNWSKDGSTIYLSTYAKKGELEVDGLGIRLRNNVLDILMEKKPWSNAKPLEEVLNEVLEKLNSDGNSNVKAIKISGELAK